MGRNEKLKFWSISLEAVAISYTIGFQGLTYIGERIRFTQYLQIVAFKAKNLNFLLSNKFLWSNPFCTRVGRTCDQIHLNPL